MRTISARIIFGIVCVACIGIAAFFFSPVRRAVVTVPDAQEEKTAQRADTDEAGAQQQETTTAEEVSSTKDAPSAPPPIVSQPSMPSPLPPPQQEKKTTKGQYEDRYISWGYGTQGRKDIDTVIIHSSYNSLGGDPYDVDRILDIYRSYNVSAHYIIDRGGTIYRLVHEKHVAWHAGQSEMPDGRMDINAFSIGIELINDLEGDPADAQYDALVLLLNDLERRYAIRYVLGHDDIAPGRKTDPWNFDWKRIGGKKQ